MSSNIQTTEQANQAQGLLDQAIQLFQAGAVKEAFEVSIRAKGTRVPLRNLDLIRAACFVRMERIIEAREAAKEELRLFPDNADARNLLEDIDQELGKSNKPEEGTDDQEFNQVFDVIRPYTMLSRERLYSLFSQAKRLCKENIPGNFVECGVSAGGSSALLAYVIRRYSQVPRIMWCFDSFSGMPPASTEDTHNGVPADATGWGTGTCAAPQDSLMEVAGKLGVADLLKPVQGYFEDTLRPTRDWVGMIALLHLDGDWYSSTKVILETLYDRVYDGGVLQIDDYGYWDGCRKAVQEFFSARNLTPIMSRIDDTGVWFEKPDRFRINSAISPRLVEEFQREDVLRMGLESQMSENERFQLYWTLRTQIRPAAQQGRINFVEVGSYAGASLLQSYLALQWFGLPVKMYAVEPQGQGQFYAVLRELKDIVSHLKMFSDAAGPILAQEFAGAGALADAIFIDGDHSYAGVKRDIEMYFPLLKVGGVMLFHDYLPPLNDENRAFILNHHENNEPGIRQACDEYFNGNPSAQPVELPLLKPDDPTQTQAWAPIVPGVFSTVKAWRRVQ